MQTSIVHPRNYVANTAVETGSNGNVLLRRNPNAIITERCIRFVTIVIAVTIVAVCAIAIPLALTVNRDKVTCQPITMTTTESTTPSATDVSPSTVKTTRSAEIRNSSVSNGNTTTTKNEGNTTSAISSISLTSVDGNTIKTTTADTSVSMNSPRGGWTKDMMAAFVSKTDVTDKISSTASIQPTATTSSSYT